MTELLFRTDAYLRECDATVLEAGPATVPEAGPAVASGGGVLLNRSVFYGQGGGQPGDTGWLRWADGTPGGAEMVVANAIKSGDGDILHLPAEGSPVPPPGTDVTAVLDWERRHRFMRIHTAMHLLCSLIPGAGVTGGQIGVDRSRLDFDLAEPPTKEFLTEWLNTLIKADHPVTESWITEAQLDANPSLVRTLSVKPPRGASGQVRLVRIGSEEHPIDLQPCGGTHVRSTGEIGAVTVTKLENKGKQNRRVYLVLGE